MAGVPTARASPPPRRRVGVAASAAAAAAAIAAAAVALASLPTVGRALNFDLPPGQEECFYEEVHAGMFYGREAGGGEGRGSRQVAIGSSGVGGWGWGWRGWDAGVSGDGRDGRWVWGSSG